MIQTKNLQKKFKSGLTLHFQDIQLNYGDLLLIKGPSGTGKTSFMKIIAKLDTNFSGICKNTISKNEIDYFFQDYKLIEGLSIVENIILGNRSKLFSKMSIQKQKNEILKIAKKLHIEELLIKKVKNLSSGQYQRICLLRTIIGNKKLLILDEPTSHLDSESSKYFLNYLLTLQSQGTTICISSHEEYIFNFFIKNTSKLNIHIMLF